MAFCANVSDYSVNDSPQLPPIVPFYDNVFRHFIALLYSNVFIHVTHMQHNYSTYSLCFMFLTLPLYYGPEFAVPFATGRALRSRKSLRLSDSVYWWTFCKMIQQCDTALCEACHECQTEVLDYHEVEFLYFSYICFSARRRRKK